MAAESTLSVKVKLSDEGVLQFFDTAGKKAFEFGSKVEAASAKTASSGSAFSKLGASIIQVNQAFELAQKVVGYAGTAFEKFTAGITRADAINDLSQKLGVSVTTLSSFELAAKTAGLSIDGLGVGFKFLAKNLSEAAAGNKELSATFAALGIDAKAGLQDTTGAMLKLADAFSSAEDSGAKTALAIELLGRSGLEMIPFLNQGREEIARLVDLSAKLGTVLTSDVTRAADAFGDNLTIMGEAVTGVQTQLAVGMLPALEALTDQMVDFVAGIGIGEGGVKAFGAEVGRFALEFGEAGLKALDDFIARVKDLGLAAAIGEEIDVAAAAVGALAEKLGEKLAEGAMRGFKAAFTIDWSAIKGWDFGSPEAFAFSKSEGSTVASPFSDEQIAQMQKAASAAEDVKQRMTLLTPAISGVEQAQMSLARASDFVATKSLPGVGSAAGTAADLVSTLAGEIQKLSATSTVWQQAADGTITYEQALVRVAAAQKTAGQEGDSERARLLALEAARAAAVVKIDEGIAKTNAETASLKVYNDALEAAVTAHKPLEAAKLAATKASAALEAAQKLEAAGIKEGSAAWNEYMASAAAATEARQRTQAVDLTGTLNDEATALQKQTDIMQQAIGGAISYEEALHEIAVALEEIELQAKAPEIAADSIHQMAEEAVKTQEAFDKTKTSFDDLGDKGVAVGAQIGDAFSDTLKAIASGTQDIGDIWESFGVNLAGSLFDNLWDEKLNFDELFKGNLLDLAGSAGDLFSSIADYAGSLFSGAGGWFGGGGGSGVGSVAEPIFSALEPMSVAFDGVTGAAGGAAEGLAGVGPAADGASEGLWGIASTTWSGIIAGAGIGTTIGTQLGGAIVGGFRNVAEETTSQVSGLVSGIIVGAIAGAFSFGIGAIVAAAAAGAGGAVGGAIGGTDWLRSGLVRNPGGLSTGSQRWMGVLGSGISLLNAPSGVGKMLGLPNVWKIGGHEMNLLGAIDPIVTLNALIGMPLLKLLFQGPTTGTMYRRAGQKALWKIPTFADLMDKETGYGKVHRTAATIRGEPGLPEMRERMGGETMAGIRGFGTVFATSVFGEDKWGKDRLGGLTAEWTNIFTEFFNRMDGDSAELAESIKDNLLAAFQDMGIDSADAFDFVNQAADSISRTSENLGYFEEDVDRFKNLGEAVRGLASVFEGDLPVGVHVAEIALQNVEKDGVKAAGVLTDDMKDALLDLSQDAEHFDAMMAGLFEQGFRIDTDEFKNTLADITASAEFIGAELTDSLINTDTASDAIDDMMAKLQSDVSDQVLDLGLTKLFDTTRIAESFQPVFARVRDLKEGVYDALDPASMTKFKADLATAMAEGKASLAEYLPQLRALAQASKDIDAAIEEAFEPTPVQKFFEDLKVLMEDIDADIRSGLSDAIYDALDAETPAEGLTIVGDSLKDNLKTSLQSAMIDAFVDAALIEGALAPLMAKVTLVVSEAMKDGVLDAGEAAEIDDLMTEGYAAVDTLVTTLSPSLERLLGIGQEAQATTEKAFTTGQEWSAWFAGEGGELESTLGDTVGGLNESLTAAVDGLDGLADEALAPEQADKIRAALEGVADALPEEKAGELQDALDALADGLLTPEESGALGETLTGLLTALPADDVAGLTAAFDALTGALDVEAAGAVSTAVDRLRDTLGAPLTDSFADAGSAATNLATAFGSAIADLEAIALPAAASGGIFGSGMAIVGEAGPEVAWAIPGGGFGVHPISGSAASRLMGRGVRGLAAGGIVIDPDPRNAQTWLNRSRTARDDEESTTSEPTITVALDLKQALQDLATSKDFDTFKDTLSAKIDESLHGAIMDAFLNADFGNLGKVLDGFETDLSDAIEKAFTDGALDSGELDAIRALGDTYRGYIEYEAERIRPILDELEDVFGDVQAKETIREDLTLSLNQAIDDFARGGSVDDLNAALRDQVYTATLTGLIDAFLAQDVIDDALDEFKDSAQAAIDEALQDGVIDATESDALAQLGLDLADQIGPLIEALGPAFSGLADAFGASVSSTATDVRDVFGSAIEDAFREGQGFADFALAAKQTLFEYVRDGLVDAFIDSAIVQGALAPMLTAIAGIFDQIADKQLTTAEANALLIEQVALISDIFDDPVFRSAFDTTMDAIRDLGASMGVVTFETTALTTATTGLSDAAGDLSDTLSESREEQFQWLKETLDLGFAQINTFGRLAGVSIDRYMPRFAAGGLVTKPTYGLIGEAGPELILPLRSLSSENITTGGSSRFAMPSTDTNDREAAREVRMLRKSFDKLTAAIGTRPTEVSVQIDQRQLMSAVAKAKRLATKASYAGV